MFPTDRSVIIHDGKIELSGWAYSGNGNWPERVEVSPDGCVVSPCWILYPRFVLTSRDSGHVWYAVDPDDLTEKVSTVHMSIPDYFSSPSDCSAFPAYYSITTPGGCGIFPCRSMRKAGSSSACARGIRRTTRSPLTYAQRGSECCFWFVSIDC